MDKIVINNNSETDEARFSFGKNWENFLSTVTEASIAEAKDSIRKALGVSDLSGKSFLDIGNGSGLFSLAARQMGASVYSFDYDQDSVRCAELLRDKYFPGDNAWAISQGSILDEGFISSLGRYDIVYSWGVLHHTGNMWCALENAAKLVDEGGRLVISIYNDQGHWSKIWLRIKQIHNSLPGFLRLPFVVLVMLPREARSLAFSTLSLQPSRYIRLWTQYRSNRGMSKWHDMVDWVGGLPFEVARPEQIIFFFRDFGFNLAGMQTCAGEIGCNEYVFRLDGQRTGSGKLQSDG